MVRSYLLLSLMLISVTILGCSIGDKAPNASTAPARLPRSVGAANDLNSLETAAQAAEKAGKWAVASNMYLRASNMARNRGQFQRAVFYGNKALESGEKARAPILRARAILQLAWAYRRVGQNAKARELLEKGVDIVKQISPGTGKIIVKSEMYTELGVDFTRTGESERAVEYISRALQIEDSELSFLKRSPATNRQVVKSLQETMLLTLERLGTVRQSAGDIEDAIEAHERALGLAVDSGLATTTTASRIYIELGQLYFGQKNFPRALENLKQALAVAQQLEYPHVIQRASSLLGSLMRQSKRPFEAIAFYKEAIESIETNRSQLETEEFRSGFFEGRMTTYSNIIRAYLEQRNEEEAFNYNERARSRAFLDILGNKVRLAREGARPDEAQGLQVKIDELKAGVVGQTEVANGEVDDNRAQQRQDLASAEKAYADFLAKVRKENKEQASLMNVEPLTLKEVQDRLDPGVTILEYFITNDSVIDWIVDKGAVYSISVPLRRKDLQAKVTLFRESISQLEEQSKLNQQAQELFKSLIQPALPHIRGKELLIIPHDVLHYLPFQALLSPNGKYLIADYPIHYLSSASLMQFTQEKRKAKGELTKILADGGKVLTFGNPDLDDPKMNLSFAEVEAKEIKSLYPQSAIYLEKEATEEKAKALVGSSDIIHFASHAELNEDDPLASAIRLAKSDREDGRLEVREIFGMDLKASLVVLSACETGLGKLSSGDELVGLTRAFIYAGTPSVVASLWNVEDRSTAQLMASFYKNLKTMTKVEALRQAQLNLIRRNVNSDLLSRRGIGGVGKLGETPSVERSAPGPESVSTSHPYFWAPFILVGEGK